MPRWILRSIVASLCSLALLTQAVWSLSPDRALTQYRNDAWGAEDGLPSNSVTALTQTRDGYLWIGTHSGLARFDGVRFEVFDRTSTTALQSNAVSALVEDNDGVLWIGTENGLSRLKDGEFTTLTTDDGLSANSIQSLYEGSDGAMWVGTSDGALNRVADGKLSTVLPPDSRPGSLISAIAEPKPGEVWLCTRGLGVRRLAKTELEPLTMKDGLPDGEARGICVDRSGAVWIATMGGLSVVRDGAVRSITDKNGLPDGRVLTVLQDRGGNVWAGTFGGLARVKGASAESLPDSDGQSRDVVAALFEDREGNLWVGTDGGGLVRFKDAPFTSLTPTEGLSDNLACPIIESRDGSIWIGTFGGGLNRYRDGKVEVIDTSDGLPSNNLQSLAEAEDGSLWIGTYGKGLAHYRNGAFETIGVEKGLSDPSVHALLLDSRGGLWVGTARGLDRLQDGKITNHPLGAVSTRQTVRTIFESRDGEILVGAQFGLFRLRGDVFEQVSLGPEATDTAVWSVHQDDKHVLWIGTSVGIVRLADNAPVRITTKDGLPDDNIYQILGDDFGNLWIGSNRGVFRVSRFMLEEFANGRMTTVPCVRFGKADGLKSEVCTHYFSPSACRTRSGILWFPTTRGATWVDPAKLAGGREPPAVLVERISADGRLFDLVGAPEIPSDVESLEIAFTALELGTPERVRFEYVLEGFDDKWVDAGARRVAYFTGLPPGDYVFRVRASSEDGAWVNKTASASFKLAPKFYETYWFVGLCVAGLGLLVWAGVRLRVRGLKSRERVLAQRVAERTTQLAERNRELRTSMSKLRTAQEQLIHSGKMAAVGTLVAGLTHELNNPLAVVSGRAQLLMREVPAGHPLRKHAERIFEASQRCVDLTRSLLDFSRKDASARSIVHAADLLGRISALAEAPAKLAGVRLTVSIVDAELPAISVVASEIESVVLNLVANAIEATPRGGSVTVTTSESRRDGRPGVEFAVADTGQGIAEEHLGRIFEPFFTTKEVGQGTGLGLSLAYQIVEAHGGTLSVESVEGSGTTMRAWLPSASEDALAAVASTTPQRSGTEIDV